MTSRIKTFAVGCTLVGLACGCSSGSGKATPTTTTAPATTAPAPSSTTTATTTTTTAPVASTTTTTTTPVGLAALLPTMVPSGFALQPDDIADAGPTNLNKAVVDDVLITPSLQSAARQVLVDAGFVRGYQRQWTQAGGVDQNYLWLYQFATPEGAKEYVQHWQTELESPASGLAVRPFTPAFLPAGAIGLHGADTNGSSGAVLFTKGPYAVQATFVGNPGVDQSGPVSKLALTEYTLLP